jgi:copper/silver efflux system protein
VMIENAHKHVERLKPGETRGRALIAAAKEVGPSLFFSLLVIVASFLPVFTLEDQEGRLPARLARRLAGHRKPGAKQRFVAWPTERPFAHG